MRPKRIEPGTVVEIIWLDIASRTRPAHEAKPVPTEDLARIKSVGFVSATDKKAIRIAHNEPLNPEDGNEDDTTYPWSVIEQIRELK